MIVSGGENVYSAEVENAIYQHDAVAQCAVIGIPSEKWGEQVHVIVVPKEGMDVSEDDLIAHVCDKVILRNIHSFLGNNNHMDLFTPFFTRNTNHRTLSNRIMLINGILNFGRIDILST